MKSFYHELEIDLDNDGFYLIEGEIDYTERDLFFSDFTDDPALCSLESMPVYEPNVTIVRIFEIDIEGKYIELHSARSAEVMLKRGKLFRERLLEDYEDRCLSQIERRNSER